MANPQQLSIQFDEAKSVELVADLDSLLEEIRTADVQSDTDYMAVLKLINIIETVVGPTTSLMLQLETSLKLFNSTKNFQEKDKSLVDVFIEINEIHKENTA